MAFSDVMQLLRDTICKRIETSLTFVTLEDSFETADTAVGNWRRRELSCRDDGEFEVYFAPSQSLGFRLTESFLMTQPLCLVSTTRSQLMPLLRCIVTNVNDHDVLGAPSNDVMHLLHDPSTFPKRIWFWKMAPGHDKAYSVVTVATPALLLASMTLSPIDLMFEVPVVHSLLPAPNGGAVAGSSTSRITYKPPPLHHPDSRVRKDQYLMAVNGVSTLNVPHDDNTTTSVSTISMLHGVLEASVPRRLRFRDMDLYKREFQAQRPLSPWKRSELHQSKPTSSRPTADCLDTSDDGSEVTVEAVTTSFSTLVSNNAAAMMGQLDDSTDERVRQSKRGMRRVVLPPSTSPLGLQLETDFSSKYTVFHRYVR
ncbi:hypothetical protein DYB36_004736 [Aphanomyces astaci]|uniref:Uncharacterized protein n=1 Tax=Aphanomyces astaci TaxID=112090 RepID=A0A397B8U2_APHAT|nr:hypothetical protein DYB36_004736 [Aphanomyces astaci]